MVDRRLRAMNRRRQAFRQARQAHAEHWPESDVDGFCNIVFGMAYRAGGRAETVVFIGLFGGLTQRLPLPRRSVGGRTTMTLPTFMTGFSAI